MPTLPAVIVTLLLPFEHLFDRRTWRKAQLLAMGAILSPGKRTVTVQLDFTQNLKEATDAITLGLRHSPLASEGFSLSAANADVQELPATLCH